MLTTVRPQSLSLGWPARPRRSVHPTLGRRLDWTSRCRCFRVTCYPDQTGRFIAQWMVSMVDDGVSHGQVLSHHHTLAAAQRACAQHARQVGGSE